MATDTRERIINAAERLFADRGVDDVSLREISELAGQRNVAAVQYHFDSKQGLIQALYRARLAPLNQLRLDMLAELRDPSLEQLVRIYLMPLANAVIRSGGRWAYARFLDRYLGRSTDVEPFDDGNSVGVTEVLRLLSERMRVPDRVKEERLRIVLLMQIRTLADLEHRLEQGLVDEPAARWTVEGLIEAATLLIASPTSMDVDAETTTSA